MGLFGNRKNSGVVLAGVVLGSSIASEVNCGAAGAVTQSKVAGSLKSFSKENVKNLDSNSLDFLKNNWKAFSVVGTVVVILLVFAYVYYNNTKVCKGNSGNNISDSDDTVENINSNISEAYNNKNNILNENEEGESIHQGGMSSEPRYGSTPFEGGSISQRGMLSKPRYANTPFERVFCKTERQFYENFPKYYKDFNEFFKKLLNYEGRIFRLNIDEIKYICYPNFLKTFNKKLEKIEKTCREKNNGFVNIFIEKADRKGFLDFYFLDEQNKLLDDCRFSTKYAHPGALAVEGYTNKFAKEIKDEDVIFANYFRHAEPYLLDVNNTDSCVNVKEDAQKKLNNKVFTVSMKDLRLFNSDRNLRSLEKFSNRKEVNISVKGFEGGRMLYTIVGDENEKVFYTRYVSSTIDFSKTLLKQLKKRNKIVKSVEVKDSNIANLS